MNRLYRLYEASPEAALAEIEETVAVAVVSRLVV